MGLNSSSLSPPRDLRLSMMKGAMAMAIAAAVTSTPTLDVATATRLHQSVIISCRGPHQRRSYQAQALQYDDLPLALGCGVPITLLQNPPFPSKAFLFPLQPLLSSLLLVSSKAKLRFHVALLSIFW